MISAPFKSADGRATYVYVDGTNRSRGTIRRWENGAFRVRLGKAAVKAAKRARQRARRSA